MNRLLSFLGSIAAVALIVVSAAILLGGGYWLSDRVYDAGLWPIGAVMRVFLLMVLLGNVVLIPFMLFSAVVTLFRGEDEGG